MKIERFASAPVLALQVRLMATAALLLLAPSPVWADTPDPPLTVARSDLPGWSRAGGTDGPGEASRPGRPTEQLVADWNDVTGQVELRYTPACNATGHALYTGPLTDVSTYSYAGGFCAVGSSGALSFAPGPGDLFFLVVGTAGTVEGSYGSGSSGERPDAAASCGRIQDLGGICDGPDNFAPRARDDAAVTPCCTVEIDVLANDTDADGDTLTVIDAGTGPLCSSPSSQFDATVTILPDWRIRYEQQPGYRGSDAFCYRVSDGVDADMATVVVTVLNEPPFAVDDDGGQASPGVPLQIDVLANDTDPNGDTLTTVSAGRAPLCADGASENGGTVSVVPGGEVEYTASPGFAGLDFFCYVVSDGFDTDTANVTVEVGNEPPVAVGDFAGTTPTDVPLLAIDVLANDFDSDPGDVLTVVSVGTAPTCTNGLSNGGGSVTVNVEGSVDYLPPAGFRGFDAFCYVVTDGASTDMATVSVEVVNGPPVANDDFAVTPTDVPLPAIDVLVNDTDPNPGDMLGVLSAGSNAPDCNDGMTSDGGTVFVSGTATLDYDPPVSFRGFDSFCYVVSDGVDTDVATVTVEVLNAAPIAANDDLGAIPFNTSLVGVAVLANDTDPNGDSLFLLSAGSTGSGCGDGLSSGGGVVLVSGADTLDYDPDDSFVGSDDFCYVVSDGVDTDVATVTVEVLNAAPIAANDDLGAIPFNTSLVGVAVLANDTDPNGDSLFLLSAGSTGSGCSDGLSSGGGVVLVSGADTLDYDPDDSFVGFDDFCYVVSDGVDTDVATVTVEVLNAAPIAAERHAAGCNKAGRQARCTQRAAAAASYRESARSNSSRVTDGPSGSNESAFR